MAKYKLLSETTSYSGAYGMNSDKSEPRLHGTFDDLEAEQAEKTRLIKSSAKGRNTGGPDDGYIGGSSDTTYRIEVE